MRLKRPNKSQQQTTGNYAGIAIVSSYDPFLVSFYLSPPFPLLVQHLHNNGSAPYPARRNSMLCHQHQFSVFRGVPTIYLDIQPTSFSVGVVYEDQVLVVAVVGE